MSFFPTEQNLVNLILPHERHFPPKLAQALFFTVISVKSVTFRNSELDNTGPEFCELPYIIKIPKLMATSNWRF